MLDDRQGGLAPPGWYAVARIADLAPGSVVPIRAFESDLVVFRVESGASHVAGAFCPHQGAHLGHGGRIVEGHLQCPFHGWRFETSGACAAVPGSDRIPAHARLETWPTTTVDGLVWAYYGPTSQRGAVLAPALDAPDAWIDAGNASFDVRADIRDIVEGSVDTVHLQWVHAARDVAPAEIHTQGDVLRATTKGRFGPGSRETTAIITCSGLGRVTTHLSSPGFEGVSVIYPTPIEPHSTHVHVQCWIRVGSARPELIARAFLDGFRQDFEKDRIIWENKRRLSQPALTSLDKSVAAFRRWLRTLEHGDDQLSGLDREP